MQAYEVIGIFILFILIAIPVVLTILAFIDYFRSRTEKKSVNITLRRVAIAAAGIFAFCLIDAFYIEPFMLSVTRLNIDSPKVNGEGIKVIHLSDIHFEKNSKLLNKVVENTRKENPHIICITGDSHYLSDYNEAEFNLYLTEFSKIAPVYFVCGYDTKDTILKASNNTFEFVEDTVKKITIDGNSFAIAGLPMMDVSFDKSIFNENDYNIILTHMPDLLDEVKGSDTDLYLAGHTHGGQIRLPVWGAILTLCKTGKKYEYGHFRFGQLNAFITRGIGLEGKPAPQARFLCPPEMVVINIK